MKNEPYIIGEIGINHNGDLKIAKELIDLAKECGCDAVKFQKRNVDDVYTEKYLNSPRESPWGKTQRAQKLGLEFGKNEYDEIDLYCKEKNIDWFASAWDIDSQIFLEQYNCKYNKIASPMITNIEFLKYVANLKKPTIISTGMTKLDDVDKAINIFRSYDCPYILMHCTSIYPCPVDKCNLGMITTLKKRYNCDVGYSGHSPGVVDSYIATVLGAKFIEKHITLDRAMYGSDQSASLERTGLSLTVKNCKLVNEFIGDGKPHFYKEEKDNSRKLRYWEK
jgi:N-acetylneuraminate synthase